MHLDISPKQFCGKITKKNAGAHDRDPHFARACTLEIHLDIAQEAFYARI